MCPASPTLGGGGGHTPGPRSEIRDSDEQSLRGGRREPGQGARRQRAGPRPASLAVGNRLWPVPRGRGSQPGVAEEPIDGEAPKRPDARLLPGPQALWGVARARSPQVQPQRSGARPCLRGHCRPRKQGLGVAVANPSRARTQDPWSQPWRLRLVTSRPRSPRRGPTAGEPAASAPSARTAPAWRAARAEVGGGVGATAPATPRPRRPSRAGPRRGPGPCSRPAAARSSASGFGSVLAGGGSAEGNVEGQTERDRPGDERSRTEPRDVSVPSSHARKEARGGGRGGRGEQRGGVCSWRGP